MKAGKTKTSDRLPMISFRVDEEMLAVIARLEAAVGSVIVAKRRRSVAIRQALIEADQRLRARILGTKK